jgi:Zn-dependent peptidase ImmA (M78 family)
MTFVEETERGYDAAQSTRVRLGLGLEAPVADALTVIEDVAGVPVTVLDLPHGLAGLHGSKGGRAFIFINGREPVVRQRFTLAHEFGHVEMGHAGSVDYTSDVFGSGRRPPTEVQADGFAAEFLAPIIGVRRWLERSGQPSDTLETVVRLANHFHLSAEAAIYRLQAARHLNKATYEPIREQVKASDHAALARRLGFDEFQDMLSGVGDNLPRLPRETLNQAANAYERGLLTVKQIAQLLLTDVTKVQAEFDRRGVEPGHHEPDY